MNAVAPALAEAVLAGMLAIWPDFLDEQQAVRCPRCSELFTYRRKRGSGSNSQPRYCLHCAKY
jgi:hypothetical protein